MHPSILMKQFHLDKLSNSLEILTTDRMLLPQQRYVVARWMPQVSQLAPGCCSWDAGPVP